MSSFTRVLRPALRGGRGLTQRVATAPRCMTRISPNVARPLSTTASLRNDHIDISEIPPTPISHLSEVEAAMADTVSKFATDVILPQGSRDGRG
ncbi:hypothetical protein FSOLCH5_006153 [Fusarium solani]